MSEDLSFESAVDEQPAPPTVQPARAGDGSTSDGGVPLRPVRENQSQLA
jgi:hypothetical protein